MKKIANEIIYGTNSIISGMIALFIVSLIALGCTCSKNLDLSNLGKKNSPTPSVSPTAAPTDTPKKTIIKADASKGEIPEDDELQEKIKTTLLDFNQAVQDGNFTSFYDKICKPWRNQTSPSKLETTFKDFIDKKINISKISSLTAEFDGTPTVDRSKGFKEIVVKGKYRTSPQLTKFECKYIPEGKEWKLSGIEVDTTQSY